MKFGKKPKLVRKLVCSLPSFKYLQVASPVDQALTAQPKP